MWSALLLCFAVQSREEDIMSSIKHVMDSILSHLVPTMWLSLEARSEDFPKGGWEGIIQRMNLF